MLARGNQAEIPWVSVLPPGVKGASEGRYVVYLFSASGESVFLSLSQAVTGHARSSLTGLAAQLREVAGAELELLQRVDLGAAGDLGQKYELATAYAIEYRHDALPTQEDLEGDLRRFLGILDTVLDAEDEETGHTVQAPRLQFDWNWLVEQTNWAQDELEALRDAIRDGNTQTVSLARQEQARPG